MIIAPSHVERGMDLGDWLRGLGLGRYEEQFRENNIDVDVLPQLTADDLRDVGVSAVGDRRRLLSAIAALVETGSRSDFPAYSPTSMSTKDSPVSAERRP